MNGRRAKYSSLAAALVAMASLAGAAAVAAPTSKPAATSAATSAIAAGEQPTTMPTFASIPPAPIDVRPFVAWRAAIADTKFVGAVTETQALAGPWTLSDTEAWAARERAAADPPAPMTTPSEANTEAFVRDMIRRATPPPRASH
jgi:hypothetical protein